MNDAVGTPVLSASGLRKEYGKGEGLVRAVAGVDLDVGAGETVAITGPSGCGKSTLLHLLGGLDRPSAGEVRLNGRRIDDAGEKALARMRRTDISYVFQSFHLMEELTAVENVELPALLAGRPPRAARRRAEELLEQVGLAGRSKFLPSALSGGQRQRVAVARALSNEPLVVLADEPTGNLDSAATEDVLHLFEDLRESGQTLIIVTHDPRIATTADRTFSMHDGTFVHEPNPAGPQRRPLSTHNGPLADKTDLKARPLSTRDGPLTDETGTAGPKAQPLSTHDSTLVHETGPTEPEERPSSTRDGTLTHGTGSAGPEERS